MEIGLIEREILIEEARALAERMPNNSGAVYLELAATLEDGGAIDGTAEALERLLQLGLQTGRFRKVHGAPAEAALLRLYHKTGSGAALQQSTQEANTALAVLNGNVIEDLSFIPRAPGSYSLTVQTDQCHLTIEIGREGIWVRDVGVGV